MKELEISIAFCTCMNTTGVNNIPTLETWSLKMKSTVVYTSPIEYKNKGMTKSKPGKSICLNVYISKSMDTIITLQGVLKILTAPLVLWVDTHTFSTAPSVAPSHDPTGPRHTCISSNNTKQKWVINLSNTPLTPAQESLLAKGPNFAIVPKYAPKESYITAVEEACSKLPPGKQMNWDLTSATYLGTLTTTTKPTSPYRNAGL